MCEVRTNDRTQGLCALSIAALEKRIRALEQAFLERREPCNCRTGGQTMYHNARELETLVQIACPAHGFRDLGQLRWMPSGLPLQPGDDEFCSCAPSPVREFLQGRRGPLDEAEQREQERTWEQGWSGEEVEHHRREGADVQRLLLRYAFQKKMRGGGGGNGKAM